MAVWIFHRDGLPKLEDVVAVSYARQMLDSCPRDFNVDAGVLAAAIEAFGGLRPGLHRLRR
jgi:hypothetical protein